MPLARSSLGFLAGRAACNERHCNRQSIPSIKINYFFPSWMLDRVFQFTFMISYMGGPELLLKCPRTVSDDAPVIFGAVQGNLEQIKTLFDNRLASPYDVAISNGRTALHVRTSSSLYDLSFVSD